jgi:hypothetical protein
VGIAVLYVAWAMFPDRLLGLGPVLGLASAGGLLLAAVSLVVRLLAGPRAPASQVRVS